ncbi:POU class 2 homeobox associating factor 3 [Sorex fumeus]|uniref:POU class 2 homeobox associating factor 3 n=1 Tax=Sorex fumeus TaxID=62283 RepID=UPI0024AE637B|nr:POU class 2 homeobox associating factor 3 [Sorex fumeus]
MHGPCRGSFHWASAAQGRGPEAELAAAAVCVPGYPPTRSPTLPLVTLNLDAARGRCAPRSGGGGELETRGESREPAGRAGRPELSRGRGQKPKVYQGVRVKITVKELLQQRRAHQAASGGTVSGGNGVPPSELAPPVSAGLILEPEPISSSTPDYFPPREFPSCVSYEEIPNYLDQIFESYLPPEPHVDPALNSMQTAPHYFPESFQSTTSCFNQSLNPGSPSDSSTLSGSFDYSYSPAQLPPYVPENYNCLPSLDTRHSDYPSDYVCPALPSHAQDDCFLPSTTSGCYCASCEADRLDTLRAAEYFSYPSTDFVGFNPSVVASTNDFYKRDTNCDMCYS